MHVSYITAWSPLSPGKQSLDIIKGIWIIFWWINFFISEIENIFDTEKIAKKQKNYSNIFIISKIFFTFRIFEYYLHFSIWFYVRIFSNISSKRHRFIFFFFVYQKQKFRISKTILEIFKKFGLERPCFFYITLTLALFVWFCFPSDAIDSFTLIEFFNIFFECF